MRQLQIISRKLAELQPYNKNARTHSQKQVREIANSIRAFGFNNPILIDEHDQIIAGHGRALAARLLELQEVPTVCLAHLSERDLRAYVLADNKLAEKAGWNRELLALELQSLIDLKLDIQLTGFDAGDIDVVLEDRDEANSESAGAEDEIPVPGAITTQVGDIWVLGSHRLACSDARQAQSYASLMPGEKAEFVFADPPYNVPVMGHVMGRGKVRHTEFAAASGEMSREEFTDFLSSVFAQLVMNSVDGSIHDICMDWRHIGEMMIAGQRHYSDLKNVCVWAKTNLGLGTFYRSKHELVFVWKSGTAPHVNNIGGGQYGRVRSNVWTYAGANTNRVGRSEELAMHPTVKPVALVADAIKDCSRRGSIVLDPFAGSGSTIIACEKVGRAARALEIDPHYVDVSVSRWQRYTGKVARLAATGQSFENVAEARGYPAVAS